jgi:hypothetical protein
VPTSAEPVAPSVPARSGGTPLSQGTHVQLEEALISAFRSPEQVNEFLSYRLDRSSAAMGPAGSHSDVIRRLIQVAQDEGWLLTLVTSALQAFPDHPPARQGRRGTGPVHPRSRRLTLHRSDRDDGIVSRPKFRDLERVKPCWSGVSLSVVVLLCLLQGVPLGSHRGRSDRQGRPLEIILA